MKTSQFFLLSFLAAFTSLALAANPLVVKTENGLLQGFTQTVPGTSDKAEVFLGVPFAAPPTGQNRWKAPQKAKNW